MVASPGLGRMALAQSAATLPGVSWPSSVVRSIHRMARSSAHSLEDFLIERLARLAALSSAPTSSTLRTPRISDPRCVRERAVAMLGLCDGDATDRPGARARLAGAGGSLHIAAGRGAYQSDAFTRSVAGLQLAIPTGARTAYGGAPTGGDRRDGRGGDWRQAVRDGRLQRRRGESRWRVRFRRDVLVHRAAAAFGP